MSLLDDTISPPVSAYSAEPLSVEEIDAHPDAARIWATIRALRGEYEDRITEAHERGLREGYDASYAEGGA